MENSTVIPKAIKQNNHFSWVSKELKKKGGTLIDYLYTCIDNGMVSTVIKWAECKCIPMAEETKRTLNGIIFSILKKRKSDTCYKDKPWKY